MLARVRVAPVHQHARLQPDVVPRRELVGLPVARQPVVAVDRDVPHAADEATLPVDAAAEHVVRAGGELEETPGFCFLVIDGHEGEVLGHGELDDVPLAVVERLKFRSKITIRILQHSGCDGCLKFTPKSSWVQCQPPHFSSETPIMFCFVLSAAQERVLNS